MNSKNHKATVKYLGVFGEDKNSDEQYLEVEKVSAEKYNSEIASYKEEAAKYKFAVGDKVAWSKSKSESINAEVLTLDDLEHKATIKFMNKDNVEKQEIVSYLDLSKLK